MQWFERFASEGLAFPTCIIAFGSIVVLRASSTPRLTKNQLDVVVMWVRWLALKNSQKLQRRGGWAVIAFATVIAIVRDRRNERSCD
jgi:hypothetical protein